MKKETITKEMYSYIITGYYFEGDDRKHFYKIVEAPDNIIAMQIVLGEIMWNSNKHFNNKPVKLDTIHYECV